MEFALYHPAAILLSWFFVIAALQRLTWPPLMLIALLVTASGPGVRQRWWTLVRRARWLLLSLALILAYGTPGEAWGDLPWAPTDAGLYEAGLHVARLCVMLGTLAWLFETLPRERLMSGLWRLTKPFCPARAGADRLVVRLALVFDYLEKAPPRGSWRHLLDEAWHIDGGPATVRIELPAWNLADSGILAGVGLAMALGVWLS